MKGFHHTSIALFSPVITFHIHLKYYNEFLVVKNTNNYDLKPIKTLLEIVFKSPLFLSIHISGGSRNFATVSHDTKYLRRRVAAIFQMFQQQERTTPGSAGVHRYREIDTNTHNITI